MLLHDFMLNVSADETIALKYLLDKKVLEKGGVTCSGKDGNTCGHIMVEECDSNKTCWICSA